MRIGTRIFLVILPGIVGVLTVTALAYWGELGRQVPEALLLIAVGATVLSMALAWRNARYVTRRIDRLAHEEAEVRRKVKEAGSEALRAAGLGEPSADELASVERLVTRLADAAVKAEREARERQDAADAKLRESGALIRATAADLAEKLDEVRLPLHILLENRFGDLNENQEEMLGAARDATDAASQTARRAITVLTAGDGALALRRDRIHAGELVDGIVRPLRTLADARRVRMAVDVAAPMPSLNGDRVRLQEAMHSLFFAAVTGARPDSDATLRASAADGVLQVVLRYAGPPIAGMPLLYGESLLRAHGGSVAAVAESVSVRIPLGA
jgi:hypothetical protein